MLMITKRFRRNDDHLHLIALAKFFMTGLRLEKRQKKPDLQKIITTAIIRVQKDNLLT